VLRLQGNNLRLVSELTGFVEQADENRCERKPKPSGDSAQQPNIWSGRSEQISLDQLGCEARKLPAMGRVFFLDFSLYRTNQEFVDSAKSTNSPPCAPPPFPKKTVDQQC
jgi:hypothetical protein